MFKHTDLTPIGQEKNDYFSNITNSALINASSKFSMLNLPVLWYYYVPSNVSRISYLTKRNG